MFLESAADIKCTSSLLILYLFFPSLFSGLSRLPLNALMFWNDTNETSV